MKQVTTHPECYTASAAGSQCIDRSTGSGNQSTKTGVAETQLQKAPVPSVMLQSEKVTEAIDVVPELQSGRVDAKKFRPRHYDINSLEIGTWRVSMPLCIIRVLPDFILVYLQLGEFAALFFRGLWAWFLCIFESIHHPCSILYFVLSGLYSTLVCI